MEDGPILELHLGEHLALDLAIDLTSTLLNVKARWCTTSIGTHEEISSVVLVALELLGVLVELEMPEGLLLNALLVGLEVVHQVLDLLDLSLSVGVHDLGQVLHQPEVSSHRIGQTRNLTQLWDKSDLQTCPPVFVDEQGLVGVLDLLIVLCLIVLGVAGLGALLVEACHR